MGRLWGRGDGRHAWWHKMLRSGRRQGRREGTKEGTWENRRLGRTAGHQRPMGHGKKREHGKCAILAHHRTLAHCVLSSTLAHSADKTTIEPDVATRPAAAGLLAV